MKTPQGAFEARIACSSAKVMAIAGMTLAFEPCMDCGGYPVVEEVSLARRR